MVQKLPLETHHCRYRHYDLHLNGRENDGSNYLLFLETSGATCTSTAGDHHPKWGFSARASAVPAGASA